MGNRGELTTELQNCLVSEGFKGTVRELRLMPYLLNCLMDNVVPDARKMSSEELDILNSWIDKRMVVSCNKEQGFVVTEKLYDRMTKITKLGYCDNVIEKTIIDKTIIFEGCDSSGKSSIMSLLWNDIDMHKHHIFDRSFISDYVYGIKFHRHTYKGVPLNTYYDYWSNYYANNKKLKVVLCTANPGLLFRRCVDKQDPLIEGKDTESAINELLADNNLFINHTYTFCEKHNVPLKIIDTTTDTLEESYLKVKTFIEED